MIHRFIIHSDECIYILEMISSKEIQIQNPDIYSCFRFDHKFWMKEKEIIDTWLNELQEKTGLIVSDHFYQWNKIRLYANDWLQLRNTIDQLFFMMAHKHYWGRK